MKVDVIFVNFPASHRFRNLLSTRIEEHVARFGEPVQSVRAVFSTENFRHHLRLNVNGSHVKLSVEAAGDDLGHTFDKAIDKLCGAMRKECGRRKERFHERADTPAHSRSQTWMKRTRGVEPLLDNAFDRFEKEFEREFDDQFEKVS